MTATPLGVDLLARALAYTRLALAGVTEEHLDRPTPCADWSLADLLAHLDDALDAFTEAADGRVWLVPATPALLVPNAAANSVSTAVDTTVSTSVLRAKTHALLAAWRRPTSLVHVGGATAPASTLAGVAALELAVHGNDVVRAVRGPLAGEPARLPAPLPAPLAAGLVEVAARLVPLDDRAGRFSPARTLPPGADASARVLAHLGRDPG